MLWMGSDEREMSNDDWAETTGEAYQKPEKREIWWRPCAAGCTDEKGHEVIITRDDFSEHDNDKIIVYIDVLCKVHFFHRHCYEKYRAPRNPNYRENKYIDFI